ncbi:MAG TPA: Calx-beta domain-containing protein, partial [Candidatus Thermoplasmatota archaeon]|nr:Calx-beta domain-containing protein [Candidatus Thermoplasmatota archaeon]
MLRVALFASGAILSALAVVVVTDSDAEAAVTMLSAQRYAVQDNFLTIPTPGSLQPGDLLVVQFVYARPSPCETFASIVVPAGWTQIGTYLTTGACINEMPAMVVYMHIVGETEPPSTVWDVANANRFHGYIYALRGIDLAQPVNAFVSQANSGSNTPPNEYRHVRTGVATTTVADTLLIGMGAARWDHQEGSFSGLTSVTSTTPQCGPGAPCSHGGWTPFVGPGATSNFDWYDPPGGTSPDAATWPNFGALFAFQMPRIGFAASTAAGSESVAAPVSASQSGGTGLATSLQYTISPGSGFTVQTGTATCPVSNPPDAVTPAASLSGTFNVAASTTTTAIPLPVPLTVCDDAISEAAETFTVTLTSPTNVNLGPFSAITYTVRDNDQKLTVTPTASTAVLEGDSGTVDTVFTLTLSPASQNTVSVHAQTTGPASGTAATAGADFVAIADETVTFSAGETTKTVTIEVNGDMVSESEEFFRVRFFSPADACLTESLPTCPGVSEIFRTITITDDDMRPFTASDATITEATASTTNAQVPIGPTTPIGVNANIHYHTDSLSGSTATAGTSCTAGVDYIQVTAGTATLTAGSTSVNGPITICGDNNHEAAETFRLVLDDVNGDALLAGSDAVAIVTIQNDDAPPIITLTHQSVSEGLGNAATLTLTL